MVNNGQIVSFSKRWLHELQESLRGCEPSLLNRIWWESIDCWSAVILTTYSRAEKHRHFHLSFHLTKSNHKRCSSKENLPQMSRDDISFASASPKKMQPWQVQSDTCGKAKARTVRNVWRKEDRQWRTGRIGGLLFPSTQNALVLLNRSEEPNYHSELAQVDSWIR